MPKLNDTQRIMLSIAAQRDDRSLYSLSPTIKAPNRGKIIASLIALQFAVERETTDQTQVHRSDGNIRYGVFATDAGIAALDGVETSPSPPVAPTITAEPRVTKSSIVLGLLHRNDGATLAELIAATDWLPHTTRAALTGLRKKGHAVERSKRGDDTCYRIPKAA